MNKTKRSKEKAELKVWCQKAVVACRFSGAALQIQQKKLFKKFTLRASGCSN